MFQFKEALHLWDQLSSGSGFGTNPSTPMSRAAGFGGVMDREENNLRGRCDSPYLVGRLDAVHHGHIDIKEHQIRL